MRAWSILFPEDGQREREDKKKLKKKKTDLVAKFSNLKSIENQLIHGSVPEVMNELAPKEQGAVKDRRKGVIYALAVKLLVCVSN